MTWCIAAVVACGALLLPARLAGQTSAPMRVNHSTAAVVQPGDTVRITVWRKPELSGEFAVSADGTLTHPLYRRIVVTGVPLATIESRVSDVLKQYEAEPQFVVEPLLRVAVGGEVRQPNLYSLRPETSVGQAVALAGGATERGRTDRILLVRDGREMRIELRSGEQPAAVTIRSGDRIVVERARSAMRDVVGPTVLVLGSIAAIINVFLVNR